MVERLSELGAHVLRRPLRVGDYIVGAQTAVERKHVLDLHFSLADGRLWSQIGGIRRQYRSPYLLVEGGDLDRGPIAPSALRGALLAIMEQGVRVLRSDGLDDSALWLYRLAVRCQYRPVQRDRPPYALRPPAPAHDAAEAMLAAVPGISVGSARALLARFGTVAALLAAEPEEWQSVAGIGPRRAKALHHVLRLPQPSAAEAQGPAT